MPNDGDIIMKRLLISIIGALTMTGCCAYVITPIEMTHTAIGETFYRVHLYGKQHHKRPGSFDVLPVREGYANRVTDGWDRKLILEIKEDKVITITSYGADGKLGGEGEDADISESHWLKKKDGSLWIDDEMWIVESKITLPRSVEGFSGSEESNP